MSVKSILLSTVRKTLVYCGRVSVPDLHFCALGNRQRSATHSFIGSTTDEKIQVGSTHIAANNARQFHAPLYCMSTRTRTFLTINDNLILATFGKWMLSRRSSGDEDGEMPP